MDSNEFSLLVVILVVCLGRSNHDEPHKDLSLYWRLSTTPARFSKSVDLLCHLPKSTCCHRYTRRWLGGHDLPLLTMNGVSINSNKYSEKLNESQFSSILTIYDFGPSDVNIPYECTYGFDKDVNMLNLNEHNFEAYDHELIVTNITTNRNVLSVQISMERVYPLPNCSATVNEKDISDEIHLISYPDGIFHHSTINISYQLKSDDCKGLFNISCYVGSNLLTESRTANCSNLTPHKRRLSDTLLILLLLILTLAVVLMIVYMLIVHNTCKSNNQYGHELQQNGIITENSGML